jgi:hypothetical protein
LCTEIKNKIRCLVEYVDRMEWDDDQMNGWIAGRNAVA